ncbi:response regulator [Planktothrix sp. FACHB-1355]|uniref:histidine kinase n=1 Tax=Aerosakkonema funiforme FACHB-1375 TaxID=2949571 RepID=A0A926VCY7_9CYAN|nr:MULTISPECIES: response regulator [Oscillatoriales]MBD2181528.1 response regulator [Aerosakkonema funiforme FACHB-1375]MBD3561118.1 response regulator [Planktothrix sp. FACHB-1355]
MSVQKLEKGIILIVDDTPTNLSVLFDMLTASGFKVFVAEDGEDAIEQLEYCPPDLILLDVIMPGIDGFETCRRLKANESTKEIPVIFMTALSDTEDKVKGLNLGAVDYITKPFQHEEVLARVSIHLNLRNLAKQLQEQNVVLQQEIQQRTEAEQALLNLTSELERRVEKRTAELAQSNQLLSKFNRQLKLEIEERRQAEAALQQSEAKLRNQAQFLEQALRELQQTQTQLVQSEKLSSLGQLVAGVAHEINNPVNFIYGNLTHAHEYTQGLLKLLNLYQQKFPDPGSEIIEELEAIDLEFLAEDLPKLLCSMQVGAERIRQIVLSLRNFSRLDESDMKQVDVHDGIESTLLILHNRLKARSDRPAIQVIKEYCPLPLVECYAGQLNQVFMNLVANAIDAIEESFTINHLSLINDKRPTIREQGQIRIQTEIINRDFIRVTIADNGPGMTDEVRLKIFDPFFTTKPIGKGTGIGLSISYQIVVEKHGGQLKCVSVPGQGTEFAIEIPIRQPNQQNPLLQQA